MSTKLKLEQIYKLYGKKVVLNGLELEVEEGEFLVVLGNRSRNIADPKPAPSTLAWFSISFVGSSPLLI